MTTPTSPVAQINELKGKLTITEIGVILSLLLSVITGAFTFGVMYGEVRENTRFREQSQRDITMMKEDISSIKTSVQHLVDAQKEDRQYHRERSK